MAQTLSDIVAAGARVEKIAGGFQFTEGPVFSRIGFLLFSDIPANRIMKCALPSGRKPELTVFRENSNAANGLTFDHQGRLLACEGKPGRVTRTEKDGKISVLAERFEGKPLQRPNDLVYAIDGCVYFTDLPADIVYYINRQGALKVATKEAAGPNGVALSPNQLILYVADSRQNNIRAFDIAGDGSLSNGRVVMDVRADGVKTDEEGNLYAASAGGIWVFTPKGRHLGTIETPEQPSNCNWGAGFRGLYITARTSLYHVPTKIPGTRTY
jgi:sugar lactone lactonase YvrE